MIYRVSVRDDSGVHLGYAYFGSRGEATKYMANMHRDSRLASLVEPVPTPTTKKEVLRMLADWATHADNG